MGHFHDKVRVIGKTVKDAKREAHEAFMYENGHRYNIYEIIEVKKVREIPPIKLVVTGQRRQGNKLVDITEQQKDLDAPKSEWFGEWEFDIHSHA